MPMYDNFSKQALLDEIIKRNLNVPKKGSGSNNSVLRKDYVNILLKDDESRVIVPEKKKKSVISSDSSQSPSNKKKIVKNKVVQDENFNITKYNIDDYNMNDLRMFCKKKGYIYKGLLKKIDLKNFILDNLRKESNESKIPGKRVAPISTNNISSSSSSNEDEDVPLIPDKSKSKPKKKTPESDYSSYSSSSAEEDEENLQKIIALNSDSKSINGADKKKDNTNIQNIIHTEIKSISREVPVINLTMYKIYIDYIHNSSPDVDDKDIAKYTGLPLNVVKEISNNIDKYSKLFKIDVVNINEHVDVKPMPKQLKRK